MSVDYSQLPLGKHTDYRDQYDPSILVGVPRAATREAHGNFHGRDDWTGFELSWLNATGVPQAACLLLSYDASSQAIVESKSLKLYLNSYNQTVFTDRNTVAQTIARDVAAIVGSAVDVALCDANQDARLRIRPWTDHCIDAIEQPLSHYQIAPTLLQAMAGAHENEQVLISHLLRSNCPVTGQPDWASVRIVLRGAAVTPASLQAYLCSFRQHQGFHEQCVERIYGDLQQALSPAFLSVEGRFTRRGGLDINPFRSSCPDAAPLGWRQQRQ